MRTKSAQTTTEQGQYQRRKKTVKSKSVLLSGIRKLGKSTNETCNSALAGATGGLWHADRRAKAFRGLSAASVLPAYDEGLPPSITLHGLVGQPQVKKLNLGEPAIEHNRPQKVWTDRLASHTVWIRAHVSQEQAHAQGYAYANWRGNHKRNLVLRWFIQQSGLESLLQGCMQTVSDTPRWAYFNSVKCRTKLNPGRKGA
eukprot:1368116-Amphidinium_carterae.1